MKTWLITGATGFVGANLVRVMLSRGDKVRCIVRKPNLCIEGLDVELVRVDLADTSHLAALAAAARGTRACQAPRSITTRRLLARY